MIKLFYTLHLREREASGVKNTMHVAPPGATSVMRATSVAQCVCQTPAWRPSDGYELTLAFNVWIGLHDWVLRQHYESTPVLAVQGSEQSAEPVTDLYFTAAHTWHVPPSGPV